MAALKTFYQPMFQTTDLCQVYCDVRQTNWMKCCVVKTCDKIRHNWIYQNQTWLWETTVDKPLILRITHTSNVKNATSPTTEANQFTNGLPQTTNSSVLYICVVHTVHKVGEETLKPKDNLSLTTNTLQTHWADRRCLRGRSLQAGQ